VRSDDEEGNMRMTGRYAEASHITMLLDCIDMCSTCTTFMLRESPQHRRVCEVCAAICDVCAASCDRVPDDDVMRRCAGYAAAVRIRAGRWRAPRRALRANPLARREEMT
jgi:hypothetical protein